MSSMEVCIIGGGASGMTAAIAAARQGARVTILEHMDRIGKKILSTGNGKCNLTNLVQEPSCYRSSQEQLPFSVIQAFNEKDVIAFFSSLGIFTKNKNGYMYPHSEQASAVLDVLRMELSRLQVQVICSIAVTKIEKKRENFFIYTDQETLKADRLILATGSKAAPVTGSDGSGYALAKAFGHHIIKPLPALVQLYGEGSYFKSLTGVRTDAKVTLYIDGKETVSDRGEVQMTDYGISGIPVFQVSRYAERALDKKREVISVLDFMPDFNEEIFLRFLMKRAEENMHKTLEEFFIGIFHKKLITVLLKESGFSSSKPVSSMKERDFQRLVSVCKFFEIPITGTKPFENAQVCSGGVDLKEINCNTMESVLVKHLFFAGEILDVDGKCGGYNLQWAWSSGYIAGYCAAKGKLC